MFTNYRDIDGEHHVEIYICYFFDNASFLTLQTAFVLIHINSFIFVLSEKWFDVNISPQVQ
jgi:hypothetical protein